MKEHKQFPWVCIAGAANTLFAAALIASTACAQSRQTGAADARIGQTHVKHPRMQARQPSKPDDVALLPIERHAQAINRNGFDLARRGALYSAQAEFVRALKMIGRARDEMHHENANHAAIAAALTALEEVDDFQQLPTSASRGATIVETVAKHQTVALKNRDVSAMTSVNATRLYCAFAQDRLIYGCGRVPAASRALYGLGNIELAIARESGNTSKLGSPKAMAMFEAALRIDPENHKAANALGVLLAQYGQHQLAIRFLRRSTRSYPTVDGWQALSEAHDALGESNLADLAASERDAMRQQKRAGQPSIQPGGINIRWVDQETFVANSPPDIAPPEPKESQTPAKLSASDSGQKHGQGQTVEAIRAKAASDNRTSAKSGFDRLRSGLRSILR